MEAKVPWSQYGRVCVCERVSAEYDVNVAKPTWLNNVESFFFSNE